MALIILLIPAVIFFISLGVRSFIMNKTAAKVVDKILISSGIATVLALFAILISIYVIDVSTNDMVELQRREAIVTLALENVDPEINDAKAKILAEEIAEINKEITAHQKYANNIWFKWIIKPLDNYDQIIADNPKINQAIKDLETTN